jgi:hypothetical protein
VTKHLVCGCGGPGVTAVADFAADGVVYLELRTTPKDMPARGVTKAGWRELQHPELQSVKPMFKAPGCCAEN